MNPEQEAGDDCVEISDDVVVDVEMSSRFSLLM